MKKTGIHKIKLPAQYAMSVGLVAATSLIGYFLTGFVDHKVVALLLLVTVSLTAMLFDIIPVLLAALLSALIWDFFFIPPRFTFHVESTEDLLMLMMYFIIAMINAVLTFKLRQIEKIARIKEEKANTLKLYNTLLNSLSHELRTPISTIIGATDTLISDNGKVSDQNRNALMKEISTASIRLNREVENLLNMSRLETGIIRLNTDWCDLNELVYTVINRLEDELRKHLISVDVPDNFPLFKLDSGLMEQALFNLVYNATKYTPPGSCIKVAVKTIHEICVIIVEDNGPGFPADEMNQVFDKFYRLKNSKTGGTGLGLSIVKGFVEAHKGTVRLENSTNGGARFIIKIPAEISYIKNLKNE